MLDPLTISSALSSTKTIYDLLKGASDTHLAMKVSSEVANIQGKLIDVQQQTLTIQQENQELRNQLDKFKTFKHHDSVMWRLNLDGTEDGSFCPPCHAEGRESRLAIAPRYDQKRDFWMLWCPMSHVDPKVIPRGWAPMKEEPLYRVPKLLIPKNYFFVAGEE